FRGDSHVETMNAILKEDPPEISVSGSSVSPALDRIVRRCLEKNPAERFHSAHDLGLALETLSAAGASSQSSPAIAAALPRERTRMLPLALAAGAVLIAAAGYFAGRGLARPAPAQSPEFQRLTFQHGQIHSAQYAG